MVTQVPNVCPMQHPSASSTAKLDLAVAAISRYFATIIASFHETADLTDATDMMVAAAIGRLQEARQKVEAVDAILIKLESAYGAGAEEAPAQMMRRSLPRTVECMVCMEDARMDEGGMELLTCCTTSLTGPFHMVCSACWPKLRHSCPLCRKRVEAFNSADLPGFIEYMQL